MYRRGAMLPSRQPEAHHCLLHWVPPVRSPGRWWSGLRVRLLLLEGRNFSLQRLHGPLIRYIKLRVAHAPGMPGTFSPPPLASDPDMHYGTCVTHVPWCMQVSLTSDFLWSRWRGKRSRHSRCMRNPQFYVSGKRPIDAISLLSTLVHPAPHGGSWRSMQVAHNFAGMFQHDENPQKKSQ